MKNIVYSIVGFTVITLSIASTFLLPDSEYEKRKCGEVTHASLNANFTAKFKDCEITFFDVWKDESLEEFLFSNDGGNTWISAKPGISVLQHGVSQCDIWIKEIGDDVRSYKIKKPIDCNCGPCIPSNIDQYQIVEDFVSNPTKAYLSFNNCCCQDYSFSINGNEISSILISLKLHVDYLNNIKYSINSVDDDNKIIYLVRL